MTTGTDTQRGRRPSSSRAVIEDAACELFLENTYSRTTIEQIATRAGVSRASFFNYFAAKSDLLWGDADAMIDAVAAELSRQPRSVSPMDGVRAGIMAVTRDLAPERLPLAVTQWELMGARDDLLASGITRFDRLASVVRRYLAGRCPGRDPLMLSAAAFAVAAAVTAAAASWASSGISRGDLAAAVDVAVTPVCEGFRSRLG